MYPPAMSADRDELVAIGRAVARHDRLFAIHMRNYSDDLLEAVTEALDVARASGCRLQISHLAVAGRRNWGKVPRALELIEAAHADGVDVGVDIYPYIAGSANLSQLLPVWAQAGGPAVIVERLSSAEERRKIREDWRDSLFFGWDEIEVSSSEPGLEETLGPDGPGSRRGVVHGPERDRARLDRAQRQPHPDGRLRPVGGRPARGADPRPHVDRVRWPGHGSGRTVVGGSAASAIVRLLPASPWTVCPGCRVAHARAGDRDVDLAPRGPGRAGRSRSDRRGCRRGPRGLRSGHRHRCRHVREPTLRPVGIQEVVVAGRRVVADGRQLDASAAGPGVARRDRVRVRGAARRPGDGPGRSRRRSPRTSTASWSSPGGSSIRSGSRTTSWRATATGSSRGRS